MAKSRWRGKRVHLVPPHAPPRMVHPRIVPLRLPTVPRPPEHEDPGDDPS